MQVDIKILVENTTPTSSLVGEYGFSAVVSVDDRNILFDTGESDAIFANSRAMGINLGEMDEIVLSHGHYDHTGGLIHYLTGYGPRDIYAHPGIFTTRFSEGRSGLINIGCPFTREKAEKVGARFKLLEQFTEIYPGIFITGTIPRITAYEDVGGRFWASQNGVMQEDSIPDDMAMVINHPGGLIIISGCSHAGMINTIDYCCRQTGNRRVQAYIGGTHLRNASSQRMQHTITAIKQYDVQKLIVGHCTGFYAAASLYCALGERVIKADAGSRYQF